MVKNQENKRMVVDTGMEIIGSELIGTKTWVVQQMYGNYSKQEIQNRIESEKKAVLMVYPFLNLRDLDGYVEQIEIMEKDGKKVSQVTCTIDIYRDITSGNVDKIVGGEDYILV